MIGLSAAEIAGALPAVRSHDPEGAGALHPVHATIDSREAGVGDLFFGLPGERVDGGSFAPRAIEQGAWGVVVGPGHFEVARAAAEGVSRGARVFAVEDPVAALGLLANHWRRLLGAKVIGVTGSTGKTSTKDILAALLGRTRSVVATPANRNTEIGLPLTVLSAPAGTEVLVLEMGMRGLGQISVLAAIAEPDVGCIVNIGPVHLEQVGSVENVAAAKSELTAGLAPGATAVIPADEPLLVPHLRPDLQTVTFGTGGDVRLVEETRGHEMRISTPSGEVLLRPSFSERHLKRNLLAAVACAQAIEVPVDGDLEVNFSELRGEISEVLGGVTLINDCYNANPVSMRAALENLAHGGGRRIAVLGGMAELGTESPRFHQEVALHAADSGVDLLVAVGELAAAYGEHYPGRIEHVAAPAAAASLLIDEAAPGDTVLVKGSRSVGLEKVGELLVAASHGRSEESR